MKILIVEDENLNQIVIKQMIITLYPNFEVDIVNNGIEALETLSSNAYDLILSDIDMPEMNGNEFLTKVREELKLKTPIIAVTAYAITGDRERLLLYGFDNYIPKPIEMDNLKNTIDNYLHTETLNINFYETFSSIQIKEDTFYVAFITEAFQENYEALFELSHNQILAGVVVPHIIHNQQLMSEGIALIELKKENNFVSVIDMHEAQLDTLQTSLETHQTKSLLLFVDGLSSKFDPFIAKLNEVIDSNKIDVIGSGVGVKNLTPMPVVFNQKGIYQDHALLIGADFTLNANAHHGWHSIYGPLVVTKSKDNIIYELNGEKAFDVYQRTLKELEGIEISPENFFDIAKGYPLGIMTFSNDEFIIRDPIIVNEDKSLTIVSSVNEYDSLFIMKGEKETLINSSKELSSQVFAKSSSKTALLFDCISRVLFLEEAFQEELNALYPLNQPDHNLFGITCVGEISNIQLNSIKVLNKTTLLGTIS
jgi:CheY-like chemotaxis protein